MKDLFICHASEDKDEVVRPLCDILVESGATVWYDDFSLSLGDSLKDEIEKGIINSRYGLVVLSESFFSKSWPLKELDALFNIEVKYGKRILPVWHQIDHEYVMQYSPLLAGKLSVSTDQGLYEVAQTILAVLDARATSTQSVTSRSHQFPPSGEISVILETNDVLVIERKCNHCRGEGMCRRGHGMLWGPNTSCPVCCAAYGAKQSDELNIPCSFCSGSGVIKETIRK